MKGNLGYKIRTITCVSCGKTATGHMRPNQRYCSLECYRNSPHPQRKTGEMKPCAQCGKEFYVRKNQRDILRCCSPECTAKWMARNKTSHTCKICGKEFKWSPSRGLVYNIKYCSIPCRDADPERRTMLIEMNAKQQRMSPNHVETIGYNLLTELGLDFLPQHLIGNKFCVDAFIPGLNTVIQFDGDYWHGNPAMYTKLDSRQDKRVKLDQSQDAYMRACGYTVIRIWASQLEKHTDHVRKFLQSLLVHKPRTPESLERDRRAIASILETPLSPVTFPDEKP